MRNILFFTVLLFLAFSGAGVFLPQASAQTAVGVCPWNGPGVKPFGGSCADSDGCSLEVYAQSIPEGWARVRCYDGSGATPAFCSSHNDTGCSGVLSDELTYVAVVENEDEQGVVIRYNSQPDPYSAVLVMHKGGAGTVFIDDRTDYLNDSKDIASLQNDYDMRVVGMAWADTGIRYGSSLGAAGRYTRSSALPSSGVELAKRTTNVFEWIDQALNTDNKPLGLSGSSGGAQASLDPFLDNSYLAGKIKYLGFMSYAPFFNAYNNCTDYTPAGTYIRSSDGALTNNSSDAGATMRNASGQDIPKELVDGIWALNSSDPGCKNKFNLASPIPPAPSASIATLTEPSSSQNILQSLFESGVTPYRRTLHASVATKNGSDNMQGVTWSTGGVYNHPYFANARRVWHECKTQTHGTQLSQPDLPCFDPIYDEVVNVLQMHPPVANAGSDIFVNDSDGDGGQTAVLDGTGSSDMGGSIVAYEWKEGDNILGTGAVLSVNFAVGAHVVILTVTDDDGMQSSDTIVVTVNAQSSAQQFYFSLANDAVIGGVSVSNEDIAVFDGIQFSVYFDGSDVGLAGLSLDAFSMLGNSEILMSFANAASIPNISGTVDDSDIVKFSPVSLGNNTSGVFSLYFDGSDVGFSTNDEDIDAAELLDDGRIIFSTTGKFSASGISGEDEDLIAFTPANLGNTTAGSFSLYFDGSDVSLTTFEEDIDGVSMDPDGTTYLSSSGNFSVSGISGADEDIFIFYPVALGANTSGTYAPSLFFDGSAWGLGGNDISAFDLP